MRAFAIRETYPQITCSTVPFCVSSCWLFVKTLCLCLTTLSAFPLNFLFEAKNDITCWHLVKSVFTGGVILGFFDQVTCISLKRNASKMSFFLPYLSTRTQSVCSHGGFVWRPVCLFIPFNLPGSPRRLLYSLPRHLDTDRFIILFFRWMLSTVSQLCLFCDASMSTPEFIVWFWESKKRNRTAALLLLVLFFSLEKKYAQSPLKGV